MVRETRVGFLSPVVLVIQCGEEVRERRIVIEFLLSFFGGRSWDCVVVIGEMLNQAVDNSPLARMVRY